ncbi:hypothetical protein J6590_104090 [Homalodisca vitripennis]|nr:hypothetical protein J6590_104090 [Homalodisca vitripennis]
MVQSVSRRFWCKCDEFSVHMVVGPPHGIKQITMFIRENVECLDSSFTTTTTIKVCSLGKSKILNRHDCLEYFQYCPEAYCDIRVSATQSPHGCEVCSLGKSKILNRHDCLEYFQYCPEAYCDIRVSATQSPHGC